MKLEVGLYFRTKAGTINKIDSLTEDKTEFYFDTQDIFGNGEQFGSKWGYTKDIIKTSSNIRDLIEVGDYVNGIKIEKLYEVGKDYLIYKTFEDEMMVELREDNVETIVTKERFENMSYKVGE